MLVLLLFSSPHSFSTGFRSEDWNDHSRSLVLCSVTHFCVVFEVCVWIIVRLEDPNMAHYNISNRVSHLIIFYLLVFDRIHDAMCLNKMSRTSSRNIGPQHQKYSSIFHCTYGVLFIPVFTKPILSVCCLKANFLVSSDHRSQSHLKFQSCLITEYAGVSFFLKFLLLFDYFKKSFSDPETQLFSVILQLWYFSHSNSPPHRALGRYRHTSSSRQFCNIWCWLEILNYCPDCGFFHCSSSFLKATSLICEAQLSFAAHQKYIIWFF